MSRGVNKVILIGNCCADPEVRYGAAGSSITNLRLAVSEKWKNKTTGETQERTEFVQLVFFGKIAEIAGKYTKKGSKLYVEGRLQIRKWQDSTGRDRYTTEVVVNEMSLLDKANQAPLAESIKTKPLGATPVVYARGDDEDDIPF